MNWASFTGTSRYLQSKAAIKLADDHQGTRRLTEACRLRSEQNTDLGNAEHQLRDSDLHGSRDLDFGRVQLEGRCVESGRRYVLLAVRGAPVLGR